MPKISQLSTISQLTTSSILPVVDNNETQKVTLKRVVEFVSASLEPSFATDIELLRSASAITSSLNAFASASTLSVATKLSTSSFEAYTASIQTINTSSLATTASNTFIGNQLINGSLIIGNPINNTLGGHYPSFSIYKPNIDIIHLAANSDIVIASNTSSYAQISIENGSINLQSNTFDVNAGINFYGDLRAVNNGLRPFGISANSLTGSINYSNLTNVPTLISSSTQITDLGFISSSVDIADFVFTTDTITNSGVNIVATSGDIVLNADGNVYKGSATAGNQLLTTGYFGAVIGNESRINTGTGHSITDNLDSIINSIPSLNSLNTFTESLSGTISSSNQITNLGFATTSSLANVTPFLSASTFNTFTSSLNGVYSSSAQLTGSFVRNSLTSSMFVGYSNLVNTQNSSTNGEFSLVFVASGSNGYLQTYTDNFSNILYNPSTNRLRVDYISGSIQATNGVISGSSQLPSGLISGSTQISGLGYATTSSVLNIDTSSLVTTSSFNTYTASISTASLVSRLNQIESVSGSWITESETSSFALTANLPVVTPFLSSSTFNTFTSSLNGTISSSVQITNLGFATTSSVLNIDTSSLVTTSSFNTFSSSINTFTSSANTALSNVYSVTSSLNSFTSSINTTIKNKLNTDGVISGSSQISNLGYALTSSLANVTPFLSASTFNTYTASLSGVISGSTQITNLGFATTSSLNNVTPFLSSSIFNTFATSSNTFSSSVNTFTSSANTALSNVYVATASLNTFTSSYGTTSASFDSRINSIVNGSGFATTSSFNSFTSSINTFTSSANTALSNVYIATASLNSKTGSYATTGSNQFNGNQAITGSLTVNSGTIISSSLTTNSSSLYLGSGSNLYVQDNGYVEITGSLLVSGSATFNVPALLVNGRGGDEGGEINLAIPVTNTTLQNRVTVDIWQNRFRVFEGSANAKGVFVDLSKAPAGVGGELMWKASGLVNTGVDVILGDLKARIPSTGNKSLQLSTTTGVTYSVYGSGIYSQAGTVVGTTINASSPLSVTSTPAYLASGYNFGTAGATDTWIIMDTSNTISWRITMILGSGFNNNMISIERLH